MEKNKRGWIKIVEAFTSVLLIAGILLIILNKVNITKDTSQQIFDLEYAMLREIQLDNNLRSSLLGLDLTLGNIEWNDADFPQDVKDRINLRKPNFLGCEAKVCSIPEDCLLNSAPLNKDVFVQASIISSNLDSYSPRQIKLYCWDA